MNKAHSPINWENYPNETTPINEGNLNKMDRAIGIIDDRVIEQETKKLSKADASSDIVNVEYDKDTSVFQFTKRNGDTVKVDVSSVVVREGYTKEESDQRYANVIKSTYAGKTIVSTDSAEAKLEGLRVFGRSEQASTTGKNLLENKISSQTKNGVNITKNDDGSITLNGTASAWFFINLNHIDINTKSIPAGDYIVSGGYSSLVRVEVLASSAGVAFSSGSETAFSIKESDTNSWARITVDAGVNLSNVILYPMIRLASITDGTYETYTGGKPSPNPEYPQPIESIGDDGSVDVVVYGKNFFDMTQLLNANGWTESDGVYSGSIENYYKAFNRGFTVPEFEENTQYTLSLYAKCDDDTSTPRVYFAYSDGTTDKRNICGTTLTKYTLTSAEGKTVTKVYSGYGIQNGVNIYLKDIQLEIGSEATSYEPYRPKQSLTIPTPNGLPAIKVTDRSLATYTDAEGNMWCADEVDFARGKYVQRIKTVTLDGTGNNILHTADANYSEQYGHNYAYRMFGDKMVDSTATFMPCMSNIGIASRIIGNGEGVFYTRSNTSISVTLSDERTGITASDNNATIVSKINAWLKENPVIIKYVIAEPIETDLTSEEIEAYRALHSNYPITTILNDENAHMEATLVVDTKNHIEQNYVPKSEFLSVVDRVSALEQRALA